jgi:NADH:ubiquinone oxidoreductase subunit 3 (subunit A)
MWLLTLYYANYVYLSLDSIQRFVQHKRYTRIAVFIFPLITALFFCVDGYQGHHHETYGKDHQIWCAFEAKDKISSIWIIMVFYLWAWLFILLSLGIVFYVIFSIQQQRGGCDCGFYECWKLTLRRCYCLCCCRCRDGRKDGEENILDHENGHPRSSNQPAAGSIIRRRSHLADSNVLGKVFSTIGIYVMITIASWVPRTFRRFSASNNYDFSSQDYLLLTLPIYFTGIAYSILFIIDPSPLKLPDVKFGTTGDGNIEESTDGIDMEWGDVFRLTESIFNSFVSRRVSEMR